jgi:hypothetical protein
MTTLGKQQRPPIERAAMEAGVQFGMNMLALVPNDDKLAQEAHITGVLIVFMGALWGTLGTEYACGFIEAQLRGMEPDVPHERFISPIVQ